MTGVSGGSRWGREEAARGATAHHEPVPAGLWGPCPPPPGRPDPDPPSGRRYRKVVSNVCEGGVDPRQSPAPLQCPLTPPRGLRVSIRGDAVAVRPGEDVLFVVRQEQVSRALSPQRAASARGAGGGRACVGVPSASSRFFPSRGAEWTGSPFPGPSPASKGGIPSTIPRGRWSRVWGRGLRAAGSGGDTSVHGPVCALLDSCFRDVFAPVGSSFF